jgi:hypothetical protein
MGERFWDIVAAGKAARLAREPISSCPYDGRTVQGRAWRSSWLRANRDLAGGLAVESTPPVKHPGSVCEIAQTEEAS